MRRDKRLEKIVRSKMSSENWLNMLTGLSQANFDKLYIKDANGNVVDILTLLGQGGGSGGNVQSVSAPLVLSNSGH